MRINHSKTTICSLASLALAAALTFSCSTVEEIFDTSSSSTENTPSSSSGGDNSSSSSGGDNQSSSSSEDTSSGNGTTRQEAISLTANQWKEGSITATAGEVWYKMDVVVGPTYYLWLNDYLSGPKTYGLDVKVEFYFNNNSWTFLDRDDINEDNPAPFYAEENGTVYFRVFTYVDYDGSYNTGSFGIAYGTSATMPSGAPDRGIVLGSCYYTYEEEESEDYCSEYLSNGYTLSSAQNSCEYGTWSIARCPEEGYISTYSYYGINNYYYPPKPIQIPDDAISLTAGEWRLQEIEDGYGNEIWYKFEATANTSYFLWWNDRYSGDNLESMADIYVRVYNSEGVLIYSGDDLGEDSGYYGIITSESTGTVYIKVTWYGEEWTFFDFLFNTSVTRPPVPARG